MQRFVVSRRFGRDSELTSALSIPNTPTSSSKATRTHSRRSSTPIHLTSKTSENLSSYTTTSGLGLDSFVSLQFVTTPSPTTSYATLSTSSSVRPQPPATYFDTRLYPPPSSPVTEPQPLSTSTFNPPIVSVVLVSSGIALITLAICVLFYRCSCAAAHESENYHQNAKESPMFGGNGVNTEKYTVMGSLDSWESMQASLAHGMGRMPQVATPYTRQSLSPSSGTVTRIDGSTSRWNMVPGCERLTVILRVLLLSYQKLVIRTILSALGMLGTLAPVRPTLGAINYTVHLITQQGKPVLPAHHSRSRHMHPLEMLWRL